MRRPPRSVPRGLASLGRTISAMSDCESRTGRGMKARSESSMVSACNDGTAVAGREQCQIPPGHFLTAEVAMRNRPATDAGVVFQQPVFSGPGLYFADVAEQNELA